MATISRGYTFGTTETVTAAKLHSLVDAATISGISASDLAVGAVTGTKIRLGSDTQGDIMYFNGTDWVRLPAGTSGQFLKTTGSGSNPSWDTPSGAASFATPTIALSDTAAAGASTSTIRSDGTIAAFDATLPVTQAIGDSSAVGSAAFSARRDHRHGMPSFTTPALTFSTTNATGSAATLLRSDAQIALFTATNPAANGTASPGSASTASRSDHVHPSGGSGGGFNNMQAFTASGTWTKPSSVSKVWVRVWGGGGGGGGGGHSNNKAGGGGGAAGYSEGMVTVTGNVSVTVGAGGAGGASTPLDGDGGSASSFAGAVTVTANGGAKGLGADASTGGAGGTSSNGSLNLTGSSGQRGAAEAAGVNLFGGAGGSSPSGGAGGNGGHNRDNLGSGLTGQAGCTPGGGGGGGGATGSGTNGGGGAGGSGLVIVYWSE